MDDYVITISAGVIVAAVVMLAALLSRYSKLVDEADASSRLAKDVWDSVNSRFSVVDARIIDLMAKTEVLSSRVGVMQPPPQPRTAPIPPSNSPSKADKGAEVAGVVGQEPMSIGEGTETEARVLRLLAEGPKNSAQIREQIGKSREHTARLMKVLFDRGLVVRNDRSKPYVYQITDKGRSYVAS